ncbi:hypothetical protein MAQ58_23965, partial [Enterobacter sp. DRP3]|nr:hypothetical protein [Enterobacter sp. DRP3]
APASDELRQRAGAPRLSVRGPGQAAPPAQAPELELARAGHRRAVFDLNDSGDEARWIAP